MPTTKLSVNLNKVATLRNTRNVGIPSVERCGRICIEAGAHGITLHPRPDERHIRPEDVRAISDLVSNHPGVELNIEGNPLLGVLEYAERYRPAQCTLVPDDVAQATSDHGWDLAKDALKLEPSLARLRAIGCRASLFVDAAPESMRLAREMGADRVELYTEPYAAAFSLGAAEASLRVFAATARAAGEAGLGVNAGHDLNLDNLGPFLTMVPGVLEVSIGHAIIADALEFGLRDTVRRYLAMLTPVL